MNLTKLGGFFVSLREESGITQKELAKKIGVKPKLVAMWEKGLCPPRADKILDLASVLGVQTTELLLSERMPDDLQREALAEEAIGIYAEISAYQLRMEVKYRRMQLIISSLLAIILGIFLIDSYTLVLFIATILPILAFICFTASIVSYVMFQRTNKQSRLPVIVGIISFFVLASILCFFIFAFWIGGPVPT